MAESIHSQRYKVLCEMLVAARRRQHLTQKEVAERLGRPQSFVSKIESGERRLYVLDLVDVAKAIGFDASRFIKRLAKL